MAERPPLWKTVAAAVGIGIAGMEAGCAPEETTPAAAERFVPDGTGFVVSSGPSEEDPTKGVLMVMVEQNQNGEIVTFPVRTTVPIDQLQWYSDDAEVNVEYREWQEDGETRIEITRVSPAGTPA